MNELQVIEYASECAERLRGIGMHAEVAPNVMASMERAEALRQRNNQFYPVSRPLNPTRHDFTETDSFWLFFTNGGEDVGSVAAKCMNIGNEKVSDFWERTFARLFFPKGDGSVASEDLTDVMRIRGRVVYMGDLFVDRQFRGSDTSRDIMHLVFSLALNTWPDFDWIYSYLRNQDIGRAQYYGFTDTLPTPLTWSKPKDGRSNNEYIAAITRERLIYSLKAWRKAS